MAGYNGYSMSNNAVAAYKHGEKPLSKWRKSDIIDAIKKYQEDNILNFDINLLSKLPAQILKKEFLYKSSWHHTSSMYNKTNFYSLNETIIDELTNRKINELLEEYKNNKPKKVELIEETWECEFLEWSGSRRHPKAVEIREIGTIKGNWFYRKDGSKKSIYANGFKYVRKL